LPVLGKMIIRITDTFPNTPIIVGGQAFRHGGLALIQEFPSIKYFKNLDETELFIKKIS